MPVPVPRTVKSQAHTVTKPYHRVRVHTVSSASITGSQLPPVGPHPSSVHNEEWASLFPSWRRNQQRTPSGEDASVQDFYQGLTAADNASVIKGAHAEACLPPMPNSLQFPPSHSYSREPHPSHTPSGHQVQSTFSAQDQVRFDCNMRWDVDLLVGPEEDSAMAADRVHRGISAPSVQTATDSAATNNRSYQAGAFSPIFEDQSPGSASGPEHDSSPLEPITPFGDFIDRAVAETDSYATSVSQYAEQSAMADYYQGKQATIETYQAPPVFPTLTQLPKEQEPIVADTITPCPTVGHKTLSEPLSEWIAGYVWKVCTTGFSLPPAFAQPSINVGPYPVLVPGDLAPSIHSLLLSTLLQPSAVFLAVWYLVRLPVYFGAAPLGSELIKERAFRDALLGDGYTGFEADTSEASPAFRLVVLGCMLANKWLDDHTFSNKTWHSISNIPVQSLNKLEALTLDIFQYDLSISSQQWSQWLAHVLSYHMSLSSPTYPQPISRPSSNPHSIVRRAIDEIIKVPSTFQPGSPLPQPVFIGLEERLRANLEKENAMDILEINLDEDGPLREEYLPKRRASKLGSMNTQTRNGTNLSQGQSHATGKWNPQDMPAIKALPPPAKWSPAGDEPILRDRNRVSGQYVAVQAPPSMSSYPASYHSNDVAYNQNWNPSGGYMPSSVKTHAMLAQDFTAMFQMLHPITYNPFGPIPTLAIPHSRSQSLSYDNENLRSHLRSYSQSRFEYKNNALHVMPNEPTSFTPFADVASKWMDAPGGYLSHMQAHLHIPVVGMQSTW